MVTRKKKLHAALILLGVLQVIKADYLRNYRKNSLAGPHNRDTLETKPKSLTAASSQVYHLQNEKVPSKPGKLAHQKAPLEIESSTQNTHLPPSGNKVEVENILLKSQHDSECLTRRILAQNSIGKSKVVPEVSILSPEDGGAFNSRSLEVKVHLKAWEDPDDQDIGNVQDVDILQMDETLTVVNMITKTHQHPMTEGQETFLIQLPDYDGPVVLQVRAFQGSRVAGHVGYSSTITVHIDRTQPEIGLSEPSVDEVYTSTTEINIIGTATDGQTGIKSVTLNPGGFVLNNADFDYNYDISALSPGDSLVIEITAMDMAGNTASTSISVHLLAANLLNDLNGDGVEDEEDLIFILRRIKDPYNLTTLEDPAADFNGDGAVNMTDAEDMIVYLYENYGPEIIAPLSPTYSQYHEFDWSQIQSIRRKRLLQAAAHDTQRNVQECGPLEFPPYVKGSGPDPIVDWGDDFEYDPDASPELEDFYNYAKYMTLVELASICYNIPDDLKPSKCLSESEGCEGTPRNVPDGVRAYVHYHDGDGTSLNDDLWVDYEQFYDDDSVIRDAVDAEIERVKEAVQKMHDGEEPYFEFSSTESTLVGTEPCNENSEKALGGHRIWSTGTVDFDNWMCDLHVDFIIHMEDKYNFNSGDVDLETGLPDNDNGRFQVFGWARSFYSRGELHRSETIDVWGDDCFKCLPYIQWSHIRSTSYPGWWLHVTQPEAYGARTDFEDSCSPNFIPYSTESDACCIGTETDWQWSNLYGRMYLPNNFEAHFTITGSVGERRSHNSYSFPYLTLMMDTFSQSNYFMAAYTEGYSSAPTCSMKDPTIEHVKTQPLCLSKGFHYFWGYAQSAPASPLDYPGWDLDMTDLVGAYFQIDIDFTRVESCPEASEARAEPTENSWALKVQIPDENMLHTLEEIEEEADPIV